MVPQVRYASTQNLRLFRVQKFKIATRLQTTAATLAADSSWEQAKPLTAIPGPKPLPIPCGNLWKFTRFGPYGNLDFLEIHKRLSKEFGPIVRITGLGREDRIFLYDADYIQTMYQNDGIWPINDFVESIMIYTSKRKDEFSKDRNISSSQGKEWRDSRSSVHKQMITPKQVIIYAEPIDEVVNIFINRMKYLRNSKSELPKDFYNEISKCVLESVANYALDTSLGCLEKGWDPESDPEKLIINTRTLLHSINHLDFGFSPPIWKYITTPAWRNFVKSMDELINISKKYTYTKLEEIKDVVKNVNYQPKSLLEALYQGDKSANSAVLMVAGLLIGANDTVATTIASNIYYLTKNPDKQEKLYQELKKFLPKKDSPITSKNLNEMKYLKACAKETLRMASTTFATQRRAGKDYVIDQYQIPKGTSVIAVNSVVCKDERCFHNSNTYLPERWMRSDKDLGLITKEAHPFAYLPFGFGTRMCMGRRFAELGMEIMVAKIIRNFKVEYNYGDMEWKFDGINKCAKPLQFKIKDRVE